MVDGDVDRRNEAAVEGICVEYRDVSRLIVLFKFPPLKNPMQGAKTIRKQSDTSESRKLSIDFFKKEIRTTFTENLRLKIELYELQNTLTIWALNIQTLATESINFELNSLRRDEGCH